MAYSEKAKVAYKAIDELVAINHLKFFAPRPDEYAYDYLNRNNSLLAKKNLVILIRNLHFDYLVCRLDEKDQVIELLSRLRWEFVVP
jgi:hypothetical protein